MQVQKISYKQQTFNGKGRQAYYLWSLVENYSSLSAAEKQLLNNNGFNAKKLKRLDKMLYDKIRQAIKIDDNGKNPKTNQIWKKHYVLLRYDNPLFEIGDICNLIIQPFFRGVRLRCKPLEIPADQILKDGNVSVDSIIKGFKDRIATYRKLKKSMQNITEQEFYKSNTLDTLYTPKFKVIPQKTKNGYLTTIINKQTGEAEKAYIEIYNRKYNSGGSIYLTKDNDYTKHPRVDILTSTEKCTSDTSNLGVLNFRLEDGKYTDVNLYLRGYDAYDEYHGIGYRLIQALVELSKNNPENIIFDCDPTRIHLYARAGLRVNPQKDRLASKSELEDIFRECEGYGLSRDELKNALQLRTKNGKTGFGWYETLETFNRLLYQKNKMSVYDCHFFPMEFTEEAMSKWSERIKAQPILLRDNK